MDIKTTFLSENIYIHMTQPKCFESKEFFHKTCKLLKSIYGHKLDLRSRNMYFDEIFK